MDKKKQIEEMAKETCGQQIYPCGDDRPFCFITHEVCDCREDNQCDHYEVCERIYNAGYRKIPENAVVLTDDEYERWQGQTLNIKKVRKETAEKFAERLKEHFADKGKIYYNGEEVKTDCRVITLDKIYEICKDITEGKG